MSIFNACDIRGAYGKELTEQKVQSIGRALGTFRLEAVDRDRLRDIMKEFLAPVVELRNDVESRSSHSRRTEADE